MNLEECFIIAAGPVGGYIPFGVWAYQIGREPWLVWKSPKSDSDFPLSLHQPSVEKSLVSKRFHSSFLQSQPDTIYRTF